MEKLSGYRKGFRVWKRHQGRKCYKGMENASGWGKGDKVQKMCQGMEEVFKE